MDTVLAEAWPPYLSACIRQVTMICCSRKKRCTACHAATVYNHSHGEVVSFFSGLDSIPPGITDARAWLPGWASPAPFRDRTGQVMAGWESGCDLERLFERRGRHPGRTRWVPVIVWLWDAGNGHGVTDDESRARKAAAAFIRSGRAGAARVEQAHFVSGMRALNPGYTRLGYGWTAQPRRDGRIRWIPLPDSPEPGAS